MPSLTSNLYRFGEFALDAQGRVLRRRNQPVSLTPKAFDVLLLLIQNWGELVTKDELMKVVWQGSFVEESNLTQTVFMLRKALGETPDQRYIVTVQGQGYRFVQRVSEADQPQPSAPEITELRQELEVHSGRQSGRKSQLRDIALIATVAVLLVAALATWAVRSRFHSAQAPHRIMVAVLPFQNFTGDPGQEYFSDGFTEEMLAQLGNLDPQHLGVIARTSVMHYKGSSATLDQIGRELGVQYVVEGSVRRDADRVRITAQLIQVKDQSHLWAREYDRELKGLFTVQSEIAQELTDEIQLTLGDRHQTRTAHAAVSAPSSYEAYDLYLRGLYFLNKRLEGFEQAADYFQQAIAKDPNYARAYAGLADTYGLMSTWSGGYGYGGALMPKARAAALKALQLDSNLAEAHTALALVNESYDYDWETAEKEFRRAIELDPNYATAHQWYGEYLSWMGRFDQALAESERARLLDPLSLVVLMDRASILFRSRQYDRALAEDRIILDTDPSFVGGWQVATSVYVAKGQFQEALDHVNKYIRPRIPPWAEVADIAIYSRWGRTAEAQAALAKFRDAARRMPVHDKPLNWIQIYIALGQKDQAIALLQKAASEHSNLITGLKVEPLYDPLRGDPRFQELLRRVRLAE